MTYVSQHHLLKLNEGLIKIAHLTTSMGRTACAFVSGRVQAVGYRIFVRRHADQLDITGFVQNLPDGRVKVVASGSETAIKELLEKMRQGPHSAVVRNVNVKWLENYTSFSRFDIRY